MAAKKKTTATTPIELPPETVRFARRLVSDEPPTREPVRGPVRDAVERAELLRAQLQRAVDTLIHPLTSDADQAALIAAINGAWERFIGAKAKHARVCLFGAIERAARDGLDATEACALLQLIHPDLAARLDLVSLQTEIDLTKRGTGRPSKAEGGERIPRPVRLAALLSKAGDHVAASTIEDDLKDWRKRERG